MKEQFIRLGLTAAIVGMLNAGCENRPSISQNSQPTPIVSTLPPRSAMVSAPEFGESFKRVAVANDIRAFEQEVESRKITFEDATRFVPLITQLYGESTSSPIITSDIIKQVFIIEESPATRQLVREMTALEVKNRLDELPTVQQLRIRYPEVMFTPEELFFASVSRQSGFTLGDSIFMSLEAANTTSFGEQQFLQIGLEVDCLPLSPISAFRFTYLHELFHRDRFQERQELDPELLRVYREVAPQSERTLPEPVEQYNFGIVAKTKEGEEFPVPLLEEIGAEYVAAKISVVNGLGYDSSDFSRPHHLYNLSLVFRQADIDDQTFVTLHRPGSLTGTLTRIGESVYQEDSREPLVVGFELVTEFMYLFRDAWIKVLPYYPEVSLSQYRCN